MFRKILLTVGIYFSVIGLAQAASLEMRPSLLNAGGFKVEFFLAPEGESLNAVEGKIVIPESFKIREVRSADSIVSFWVEKPNLENKMVTWSGIMPNGFDGVLDPYKVNSSAGKLFEIFFSEKPAVDGELKLLDGLVFLNDGLGTSKILKTSNLKFSTSSLIGFPIKSEMRDILPPEEFLPLISRDPSIFENQWFLSFSAVDKQSGVSDYYVYESTKREESVSDKDWQKTESPYLLKDQTLESFVFVRAVDGAGNERTIVLNPTKLSSYSETWFWIIIILIALGVSVLFFRRFNRRK